MKTYWPWALLIATALVLYLMGYRVGAADSGPILLMALIVIGAGGLLVTLEYKSRR